MLHFCLWAIAVISLQWFSVWWPQGLVQPMGGTLTQIPEFYVWGDWTAVLGGNERCFLLESEIQQPSYWNQGEWAVTCDCAWESGLGMPELQEVHHVEPASIPPNTDLSDSIASLFPQWCKFALQGQCYHASEYIVHKSPKRIFGDYCILP